MKNKKYYQVCDGWFTYYVNAKTGKKKFKLSDSDILVKENLDDFSRKEDV